MTGPTVNATSSAAELLSDSAIYRRTSRGQRALLRSEDPGATAALRLLARVNGFTELRRLIDLSPGDAPNIGRVISQLVADELIERVDPREESS